MSRPSPASSRLRRLARPRAPEEGEAASEERCELCSAPLPAEHRHLLDTSSRELLCACGPCSVLFDRRAASEGHYRLVGDRRLGLVDFEMDDPAWAQLRIPVDMAFFFRSSREQRVMAFYPSPMGPTESLLSLDAWGQLEAANPVLAAMEPDVEALLVNRARGARKQWVVPIDDCYALVGVIRTRWRGFTGGKEVWEDLERFFERLDRRSRPTGRDGSRRSETAALPAAEGR